MPLDVRWKSVLEDMHQNAKPGTPRTDISLPLLQVAYSFVESPQKAPRKGKKNIIGFDKRLLDFDDNICFIALVTYFISSNDGDAAGAGAATCYSGTKASSALEHYILPPFELSGWMLHAFIDMCESKAEFLHRAKLFWNGKIEHQTPVYVTALRLKKTQLLSVDSDFETRKTRSGDHAYVLKSTDSVLGIKDLVRILNGPEVKLCKTADEWLLLYILSKLAWRLDMIYPKLSQYYDNQSSCLVMSIFYHFLPVYMQLCINTSFRFSPLGDLKFDLNATVNDFSVVIKSVEAPKNCWGLNIKNRVPSMAFSATLSILYSWLAKESIHPPTPSKLHAELKVLGDMRSVGYKISAKYNEVQAVMSFLLHDTYPHEEYYQNKLHLYADVLMRDRVRRWRSDINTIEVKQRLQSIGVIPSSSEEDSEEGKSDGDSDGNDYENDDDDNDDDDDGNEEDRFYHLAGATQGLDFFTGQIPGEQCIPKKGWAPQSLIAPRKRFFRGATPYVVTVEEGKVKSSKGVDIIRNDMKMITGVSASGFSFSKKKDIRDIMIQCRVSSMLFSLAYLVKVLRYGC